MFCSKCKKIFEPNSCESNFCAKICYSCRNENRHPNSLVKNGNSLWILYPRIAHQWVKELNSLLPSDIGFSSQKSFYFYCEKCHAHVSAAPGNLIRSGFVQCSKCAYVARGVSNSKPKNKTVSQDAELLKLWDFKKNEVAPDTVAIRSNKYFYWLCELGHSTHTTVDNRAKGRRCGKCTEKFFVSNSERELGAFIKSVYDGVVEFNKKNYIHPYELDIVIPDLRLAIEFNGTYFHGEKMIRLKHNMSGYEYHSMKLEKALEIDLALLFVWEDDWYNSNIIIKEELVKAIDGLEFSPLLKRLEVSAVDEKNC